MTNFATRAGSGKVRARRGGRYALAGEIRAPLVDVIEPSA